VSYFAAAVVRGPKGWSSAEVDLTGAADIEEVADRLRDVDNDADVSIMFVESDDVYLAILRLDEGEDLRVFGLARRAASVRCCSATSRNRCSKSRT
jgi:putative tRNA adenosine deaminase-associated protein